MAAEVHVGDLGTVFEATVKDQDGAVVDISGATTKQMIFRRPNGTPAVAKTAALVNTGTDGKMKYTTITGDLDVPGEWRVQGRVVIGGGDWKTDEHRFNVFKVLV